MNENIFCHICDEELADNMENLPDKCPVCDTRKYEIIQEIQTLEEDAETGSWPQPTIDLENSISAENPVSIEETEHVTITEEVSSEKIVVKSTEPEEFYDIKQNTVVVEEQDPISDIVYNDEESDNIVFRENEVEENVHVVVGDVPKEMIFDDSNEQVGQDVVFENAKDVVFEESSEVIFEEKSVAFENTSVISGPQKTGASALEVLPDKETGFPPGSYLILYSTEKKAIAYFKIDNAGSIIIGRSSERGSPNDIDLTMAWKQAHKEKDSEALQNRMRMVKGISRKHALIRYDDAKKGYVFFHLSDKNYTIVSTPTGEKRERAPKNRNPIFLEPGSLVSMGNHKNYIIMRFKEIF